MNSKAQSAKILFIGELLKVNVSVSLAEQAYSLRRPDIVAQVGRQLSNSLVGINEWVGQFYEGLALSGSLANRARADAIFAQVAEHATPLYRAKALLALGSLCQRTGDNTAALEFYQDAERLGGSDGLVRLYTGENRAIIESARGNHKDALRGFQASARYATGCNLFNNLNSQAEELKNLGRHTEALHLSALCLASPYAKAYPEWHETACSIPIPSRSQVYIPSAKISARISSNHLALMKKTLLFPNQQQREHDEVTARLKIGSMLYNLSVAVQEFKTKHPEDVRGLEKLFHHYETTPPEQRQAVVELNDIYEDLNPEQRRALLDYARAIKKERENEQ